jgi:hypothetical protein
MPARPTQVYNFQASLNHRANACSYFFQISGHLFFSKFQAKMKLNIIPKERAAIVSSEESAPQVFHLLCVQEQKNRFWL